MDRLNRSKRDISYTYEGDAGSVHPHHPQHATPEAVTVTCSADCPDVRSVIPGSAQWVSGGGVPSWLCSVHWDGTASSDMIPQFFLLAALRAC